MKQIKILMKYVDWLLLERGGIKPEIGDIIISTTFFKRETIDQSDVIYLTKALHNKQMTDTYYVEIDYNPNIKKATELLNDCQDIFNELDSVTWNDESAFQQSSYEETQYNVNEFLENK